MKSTYLNIIAIVFLILLSRCNTIKIAEKQNINKSVDVVLPYNLILKTPIIDVKQLKYDVFLNVLKKLNNVNGYYNNCEITKNDTEDWNSINEIAKENISLLSYNDKDFKVLMAVSVETVQSPHTAFSELEKENDLFSPFVYLEVEYTDKSKGVINIMYKSNEIYYLTYTETLAENKDYPNFNPHSLVTKIFYYPNGNVKSYYTKSSFLDYKIGNYCEYSEDGSVLKNSNIEDQFNLNLNEVFSIINEYQNIPADNSLNKRYTQMNLFNQYIAFPGEKVNRYLGTNYGKVWIIKRRGDIFLIDDSNSKVIAKNNFVEFSKQEYEKRYNNIDFKEIEQELGKKVLIINNSDDVGIK